MKTWQDNLNAAGFPAPVLVLDFETYYDSNFHLGKDKAALSVVEYVTDPRFEFHGVGFQVLNHKWSTLGPRFVPAPKLTGAFEKFKQQFGCNLHNVTIVMANAKFDALILAEKYDLYPPYIIDVEDLVRYYDAKLETKLAKAGPFFGFGHKGDTSQFKGQHFDQIDLKAMAEYTINDIDIEAGLFRKLLPIIDNPQLELALMQHTLRLYTKPKIRYNFDLADRLIHDMNEQIRLAVKDIAPWIVREVGFTKQEQEEIFGSDCWLEIVTPYLTGDLAFARLLRQAIPADEPLPLKPGKPSKNMIPITGEWMILALAKDDDGGKALLHHKDPVVRALAVAHQAVSSWPGHVNRVEKMRRQAMASGGLLRVPLKYYGAHTGRWSGEHGINLGNLGGSGRGKAINKLIGEVRHTMIAPEGKTFVLCDAAQIEARDLAKYAGQTDLVEGFRTGADIYSEFASELFQTRVWKPSDEEKQTPEGKRAEIYRGFGKDAILGCGYGMGANKFHERCLANETLRPLFDSGEYDYAFVKRLVDTYRSKYSQVPKFWGSVERAWRVATRYERQETVGRLTFWHNNSTTFLRLPSGRILRYRNARVNKHDELIYVGGDGQHTKLWGGSITENIVQSTCRDYLALWILEVDPIYPVVHHVYDEIISLVDIDQAEQARKEIEEIMSRGPEWADGMPFKAEGSISPYYKK